MRRIGQRQSGNGRTTKLGTTSAGRLPLILNVPGQPKYILRVREEMQRMVIFLNTASRNCTQRTCDLAFERIWREIQRVSRVDFDVLSCLAYLFPCCLLGWWLCVWFRLRLAWLCVRETVSFQNLALVNKEVVGKSSNHSTAQGFGGTKRRREQHFDRTKKGDALPTLLHTIRLVFCPLYPNSLSMLQ